MHNGTNESPATFDASTAEKILALAVELQHSESRQLSIDELHRIAGEAGVGAGAVDEAIRRVVGASVSKRRAVKFPRNTLHSIAGCSAVALFAIFHSCMVNLVLFRISYGEIYTVASMALAVAIGWLFASRRLGSTAAALAIGWAISLLIEINCLNYPYRLTSPGFLSVGLLTMLECVGAFVGSRLRSGNATFAHRGRTTDMC